MRHSRMLQIRTLLGPFCLKIAIFSKMTQILPLRELSAHVKTAHVQNPYLTRAFCTFETMLEILPLRSHFRRLSAKCSKSFPYANFFFKLEHPMFKILPLREHSVPSTQCLKSFPYAARFIRETAKIYRFSRCRKTLNFPNFERSKFRLCRKKIFTFPNFELSKSQI